MTYDYNRWKNFSMPKLVCQHTGKENPDVEAFTELMDKVQELRDWLGKPMYVKSAYRAPNHPIELRKATPGQHSRAAIDFQVDTVDCHKVVQKAFELGFTGIGINLSSSQRHRFIHLDLRKGPPMIWSY